MPIRRPSTSKNTAWSSIRAGACSVQSEIPVAKRSGRVCWIDARLVKKTERSPSKDRVVVRCEVSEAK
jgi:hypothetical protein